MKLFLILGTFISTFLISCGGINNNKNSMSKDEKVKKDVLEYLNEKYEGSFEVVNVHSTTNEGNFDPKSPYEVRCIDKQFKNDYFFVDVVYPGKESPLFQEDGYPLYLIQKFIEKEFADQNIGFDYVLSVQLNSLPYDFVNKSFSTEAIPDFLVKNSAESSWDFALSFIAPDIREEEEKYEKALLKFMVALEKYELKEITLRALFYDQEVKMPLNDLKYRPYDGIDKAFPSKEHIIQRWVLGYQKERLQQIKNDPTFMSKYLRKINMQLP